MLLYTTIFFSFCSVAEGMTSRYNPHWPSTDSEEEEPELHKPVIQRILAADPNAICTEPYALQFTDNSQCLTNLAMLGYLSMNEHIDRHGQIDFAEGFLKLLYKEGTNPNILMVPPSDGDNHVRDLASPPYYLLMARLSNGKIEDGRFPLFSTLCRLSDHVVSKMSYLFAQTLFKHEWFDFNQPVWIGTNHSVSLLEAVVQNIGRWDDLCGHMNFQGGNPPRGPPYLDEEQRDGWVHAMGMLKSLAEDNESRIRAREQRVKECVAMLIVAKRRLGTISNQVQIGFKNHILKPNYMSPILFDANLRARMGVLLNYSPLLKVNRYFQMIVPADFLNHPSFDISRFEYGRVKALYFTSGLQEHFVPRPEYENSSNQNNHSS